MNKNKTTIIFFASSLIIIIFSVIILIAYPSQEKPKANYIGISSKESENFYPGFGGDFILTDQNNKSFNSKAFHDKILLIYFGFLSCPDICPSSIYEITEALDKLGKDADKILPIFITIDPERDSPEKLNKFFSSYDSRIIALTGSKEEIKEVAKKFKVYFAKADDHNKNSQYYMMDHSSLFYLVGLNGEFKKPLASGSDSVKIADEIRKILYN